MFDTLNELLEAREYKDKRSVSWNRVSQEERLSENFIRENQHLVNWQLISRYQDLSESFIREFSGLLFWNEVIRYQKLSEAFIEEYAEAAKWQVSEELLSKRQLKTLEKEGKPFDARDYWTLVSVKTELFNSKGLSPAFIEKHADKLSWPALSMYQHLPMPLIDRHQHEVDWIAVTRMQVLSERFIEKHRDKVEWETISFHQNLSERFINRHHAKMSFIAAEQKRSEAFLYTHLDKMDAATLISCQDFRKVYEYDELDIYVIHKNGRNKYLLKFQGDNIPGIVDVQKTDDEGLLEYLNDLGLHEEIARDFPHLMLGQMEDYDF